MRSQNELLKAVEMACEAGECASVPDLVRLLQNLRPTQVTTWLEELCARGEIFTLTNSEGERWHARGCEHAIRAIDGLPAKPLLEALAILMKRVGDQLEALLKQLEGATNES